MPVSSLFTGYTVDATTLKNFVNGAQVGRVRTGATYETLPRLDATGTVTQSTTKANVTAIYLPAGTVVTNLTFLSSTTAAGTPTNSFAGLYSLALAQLALSADKLTAAWAANSEATYAMATPYTVTADGLFYVYLGQVATTPATLAGLTSANAAVFDLAPSLGFQDNTTVLSNLASVPATVVHTAGGSAPFYAYVS